MNKVIIIFIISILVSFSLAADPLNSIKAVEETALMNNLEYKTAVLEILKAKNNLETYLKFSNSSINLSGTYKPEKEEEKKEEESPLSSVDWSAAASLPVLEQITLGAMINKDLNTTISININPLVHSVNVKSSKLNYMQKIAAAKEKAEEIGLSAIEAYLKWASAKTDYEIKQKNTEIKKTIYEDEKIRLNQGESNLDNVRDAFKAWSDARTELNSAFTQLASLETTLYSILNVDSQTVSFLPPDIEAITENIQKLTQLLKIDALSEKDSYNILSAEINKQALKFSLDNTWMFEPDLNINASLIFPSSGEPANFSVTASVKIGMDNWKADERIELKKELEISMQSYNQTVLTEKLTLKKAITSAENSAINYSIAETGVEQAKELFDEANFLFKTGDYSEADRDETEIEYKNSKKLLFDAAADRLLSLKTLEKYYDRIDREE